MSEEKDQAVGENQPDINIKDILAGFKASENKAGIVTQSDVEETRTEREIMINKTFPDRDNCICKCHPNKNECMECYQHPTHLKKNRNKTV